VLVLTRKLGESIVIGDNIRVTVVEIHGKQVRLGIEAPKEVSVHRGEVYERIVEENKRAVGAGPATLNQIAREWGSGNETAGDSRDAN